MLLLTPPEEGQIDLADNGTGPFLKLFYASNGKRVAFVRLLPKVPAVPRHS